MEVQWRGDWCEVFREGWRGLSSAFLRAGHVQYNINGRGRGRTPDASGQCLSSCPCWRIPRGLRGHCRHPPQAFPLSPLGSGLEVTGMQPSNTTELHPLLDAGALEQQKGVIHWTRGLGASRTGGQGSVGKRRSEMVFLVFWCWCSHSLFLFTVMLLQTASLQQHRTCKGYTQTCYIRR